MMILHIGNIQVWENILMSIVTLISKIVEWKKSEDFRKPPTNMNQTFQQEKK